MTLLMILTTAVCFTTEKRMEPIKQGRQTDVAFRVPAGDREEEISWWSEDSEHAYVFLPSYAELRDVSVILGNGIHAAIGNTALSDGMDCGAFDLDTDYEMIIQNQNPVKLRFVRSGNLPTMFIHTVSGTEETIHTQRNVWEYAQFCLVDTEGKSDYQSDLDEISGRGSGTWFFDKKSYNLKLNHPEQYARFLKLYEHFRDRDFEEDTDFLPDAYTFKPYVKKPVDNAIIRNHMPYTYMPLLLCSLPDEEAYSYMVEVPGQGAEAADWEMYPGEVVRLPLAGTGLLSW